MKPISLDTCFGEVSGQRKRLCHWRLSTVKCSVKSGDLRDQWDDFHQRLYRSQVVRLM